MSTIETILSRAMNDPEFAELLFTDSEKALAEYHLPDEIVSKLIGLSRSKFEAMTSEGRRSMLALDGLGIFKIDSSPR